MFALQCPKAAQTAGRSPAQAKAKAARATATLCTAIAKCTNLWEVLHSGTSLGHGADIAAAASLASARRLRGQAVPARARPACWAQGLPRWQQHSAPAGSPGLPQQHGPGSAKAPVGGTAAMGRALSPPSLADNSTEAQSVISSPGTLRTAQSSSAAIPPFDIP